MRRRVLPVLLGLIGFMHSFAEREMAVAHGPR